MKKLITNENVAPLLETVFFDIIETRFESPFARLKKREEEEEFFLLFEQFHQLGL